MQLLWQAKQIAASLLLLLLFTVSQLPTPTTALVEDVLDVIHVVNEVASTVLKAWDIVQSSPLASSIEFPLMREKQKKVLQRLKEVSRKIDETEAQVNKKNNNNELHYVNALSLSLSLCLACSIRGVGH